MSDSRTDYLELFNAEGSCVGVYLSDALWVKIKDHVLPLIEKELGTPCSTPSEPEVIIEPMGDLNTLLEYWDFSYPFTYDIACDCCGSTTEDWRMDEPRKFYLRAANFGGLVNYQCQQCKARVIKRYFKKHMTTECHPYVAD